MDDDSCSGAKHLADKTLRINTSNKNAENTSIILVLVIDVQ
jgi:hypothetical protein